MSEAKGSKVIEFVEMAAIGGAFGFSAASLTLGLAGSLHLPILAGVWMLVAIYCRMRNER